MTTSTVNPTTLRKKNIAAKTNHEVQAEGRRYSLRTQIAFLPDLTIARSWFFRFLTLCYYYIYKYVHRFEMLGTENLDPNRGYLMIARHSTHNAEIIGTLVCMYHESGRVIRSLIHRQLPKFFPFLRLMGLVSGERETAISLLKSNFWVAVVPGGAEEGMIGHENAYKVCWPEKRKGFAQVAMDADVPIVPIFLENVEEMRWNPFLYLWNLLGLSRYFQFIFTIKNSAMRHVLVLIASTVWFIITFFQCPIPVKLTLHVGKPIFYDKTVDRIEDIVERSRQELQALIDKHQHREKSYIRAIKQNISSFTQN